MEQGGDQGFFFPGAAVNSEDGDAQASETNIPQQTVQTPVQGQESNPEPNYALWLWYLYFQPKRFFEQFVVEPMPFLTVLCAWTYGMAAVIDRIAMQHMQGRSSSIAMEWGIYMLLVAGMGILGGAMQYLIGGWWYRVRLVWSGAQEPDPGLAKRVYVYASQVAAIPIVLATLGQATIYRTPVEMIEASSVYAMTVALVVMLFVLWSVWTSYRGVTTLFPTVSLGRARTWFLILPGLIHSILFALVLLAAVITRGQITEAPDLENPESFRGKMVRFGYPGNWTPESSRVQGNRIFSLQVLAEQDAIFAIEIYHSKALPEEELAMIVSGLQGQFSGWRDEYLASHWGSVKGVGVKAVADIDGDPYRFTILISPLAPGRYMQIRQVVLLEHEKAAQPGFDLIKRSFKISQRLFK